MDNIRIERIWQDDDFFEILITCSNKMITSSTEVYVTDFIIQQLQTEISQFLQFEKSECFWASGQRGVDSTSCVEFRFFMKNSSGHVLIECFMELNDGGSLDKHTCCFFINTELGMLYEFNSKLDALKKPEIGINISIVEENE